MGLVDRGHGTLMRDRISFARIQRIGHSFIGELLTKGAKRGVRETGEVDVENNTSSIGIGGTCDETADVRGCAVGQRCSVGDSSGICGHDGSITQFTCGPRNDWSCGMGKGEAGQGGGENSRIHL